MTDTTQFARDAQSRRDRIRTLLRLSGMLPVLILLCIGFELASGRFISVGNLSIVMQQASINAVLAAGMTFVILTGGIDLSVGSILALSAVIAVSASLAPGLSWAAIPLALLAGAACGLLNGGLIAWVGLPPFIVTLGALTAVRGVARLAAGDSTVFNSDLPFSFIGNGTVLGLPWLVVIAFVIVLLSWLILRRTVLGTWIYAVGGNAEAAALAGIKVPLVLLFAYAASGLLSGLGGVMSAARLYAANGLQLGQAYELDAIAAVILGGTSFVGGIGSVWGTLIGALIIAVLSNGLILLGVSDIWQYIIKGGVIILAVTIDKFRTG
ncbi:ABC transporter permease subunit [Paracoccus sp. (in: a-proteobacteria)]|uniref:ABC transporter permease subunit n=1 Tax=Paracoccus sp. TaxID=267 RepID=UPI003A8C5B5A